jgi:hypothetical protein
MSSLSIDICNYINEEWIAKWNGSIRSFAEEHDVDEKTVRQIIGIKNTPYKIGLYTLENMCTARGIKLQAFFKSIDR